MACFRSSRWAFFAMLVVVQVLLVSPLSAATQYTNDGVTTAGEELQRWYINRARFAPEAEADRLGLSNAGNPSYDACEGFADSSNNWPNWVASNGPLAPNDALHTSASKHAQDMIETTTWQHESPSGNYYTNNSSPWDRMAVEGYTNYQWEGENISVGWPSQSARASYESLFIDSTVPGRGHRENILFDYSDPSAFRELGVGHRSSGSYEDWVNDFGSRWGVYFFTDTIFVDGGNMIYEEGEGCADIEIRLLTGGVEGPSCDLSTASGSFAIPIQTFTAGQVVVVRLVNISGSSKTLCIPTGFSTATNVTIANGASSDIGAFTQPATMKNFGFRNLGPVPPAQTITATAGANGSISPSGAVSVNYGANQAFTITPALHYHVTNVIVDSSSVGTPGSYTFTNVIGAHTIWAGFDQNIVTNGVPESWMAIYGQTNYLVDATNDPDGDGIPTWEEYYADTLPTNKLSSLCITNLSFAAGNVDVKWTGGQQAWQILERSTNLQSTATVWTVVVSNAPPNPTATNFVSPGSQSNLFYRIRSHR